MRSTDFIYTILCSCERDSIKFKNSYSRCQSLKPSLVFLNRASYARRRYNDVTSQEREVTMMLRHNLRTDEQICVKSATQASFFVRHGRGVNRVYCNQPLTYIIYWTKHSRNDPSPEVQGAAVTCYIPTGRRHDPALL